MAADPLTSTTVDELLNFDSTDDENSLKANSSRRAQRDDKATLSPRRLAKRKADELEDTLGVNSEVKIKKQRKPIAKLDEARLLSAPGLPKLRSDVRKSNFLTKKLRLRGKGHEFSDVARLLNYYQLWLDDLYPRAKFGDALQLVEKAGHSKRMTIMRKEWINEGKPGYIREREERKQARKDIEDREGRQDDDTFADGEALMGGADNEVAVAGVDVDEDALFMPDRGSKDISKDAGDDFPEDDDLDALLAEQDSRHASKSDENGAPAVAEDSEGEDDLDALLAEQDSRRAIGSSSTLGPKLSNQAPNADEDEDLDDLDALLAEQESRSTQAATRKQPDYQSSTIPFEQNANKDPEDFPVGDEDELDALLAEQQILQEARNQEILPSLAPADALEATSRARGAQLEEEGEEAAEMFSSSPVRRTAASPRRDGSGFEAIASPPTGAQEDSQPVDAGDMFSSSPLQNE
jgi:replication fork protection complex subunit Csm3/Swi3